MYSCLRLTNSKNNSHWMGCISQFVIFYRLSVQHHTFGWVVRGSHVKISNDVTTARSSLSSAAERGNVTGWMTSLFHMTLFFPLFNNIPKYCTFLQNRFIARSTFWRRRTLLAFWRLTKVEQLSFEDDLFSTVPHTTDRFSFDKADNSIDVYRTVFTLTQHFRVTDVTYNGEFRRIS